MKNTIPFGPANILLPKQDHDKWACIACDQFTSQREYWEAAESYVGDSCSALHIILPEVYLEDDDCEDRLKKINRTMQDYLEKGILQEYSDSMILVERTMKNGKKRRGIVGAFELAAYSYDKGSTSLIRPTEGTVLSRLPARVNIRQDASLELPHIMVLMDDRQQRIVEKIDSSRLPLLYDVDLMLGGGHISGWLIDQEEQKRIAEELALLAESCGKDGDCLLFAVGDGNHSLAAAKAASKLIGTPESGWALAELVNIHDEGVSFEPIYRVLFHVEEALFLEKLREQFPLQTGKPITVVGTAEEFNIYVDGLESDVLQQFIDAWIEEHPMTQVDYIHGEQAVRDLSGQEDAIGFLYGGMNKDELFDYVRTHGVLPRKTFSIGHAEEKRYYMEARKIR